MSRDAIIPIIWKDIHTCRLIDILKVIVKIFFYSVNLCSLSLMTSSCSAVLQFERFTKHWIGGQFILLTVTFIPVTTSSVSSTWSIDVAVPMISSIRRLFIIDEHSYMSLAMLVSSVSCLPQLQIMLILLLLLNMSILAKICT